MWSWIHHNEGRSSPCPLCLISNLALWGYEWSISLLCLTLCWHRAAVTLPALPPFTAVCLRSKALKERNTRFRSLSQHVLPQRLCVAHNRHRVLGRSLVEMCLWTLVFASSFLSTVNKSSMLSCPAWRCCVCGDLGLYRWLLCCCFHWRAPSGTGQPFVL